MEHRKDQDQKSWKEEVEEVIAKQAYAMNYEHGITCRVLPTRSEEGTHSMQVALDLTHSGYEFDLDWFLRFSDDRSAGVTSRLVAAEEQGGNVREEGHWTVEDLRKAAAGMPYFVHGFFAGRRSCEAAESSQVSSSA